MGKRTHHQRAGMKVKRMRFLTKKGPSGVAGKDYSALRGMIQGMGLKGYGLEWCTCEQIKRDVTNMEMFIWGIFFASVADFPRLIACYFNRTQNLNAPGADNLASVTNNLVCAEVFNRWFVGDDCFHLCVLSVD
ncbi:hypothetical protein D7O18_23375 [Salmonella enterica subsp. enterica serovar Muenchen]|nr:hypothetical protein [Salmonella enterica subsp. enterica serovar Muenchen]